MSAEGSSLGFWGMPATSVIIGGVIAAGVIGVAIYIYLKKSTQTKKQAKPTMEFFEVKKEEQKIELTDNSEQKFENAKQEFEKRATSFMGIYEPLYRVGNDRSRNKRNVFGDWHVRMNNLPESKNLQKIWNEKFFGMDDWTDEDFVKNAKIALELLREFGVERSGETSFKVDDDTYRKYSTEEEELIEDGNPVKVILPCWMLGDMVVEKGRIDNV